MLWWCRAPKFGLLSLALLCIQSTALFAQSPYFVKDITTTNGGARPSGVVACGSTKGFLLADDGVHGLEPWSIQSENAAPSLLVDLTPGAASSDISMVRPFQNGVLFYNDQSRTLYRSNCTSAGTVALRSLPNNFYLSGSPSESIMPSGNSVFILGQLVSQASGSGVWVTDGNGSEFTQAGSFDHVGLFGRAPFYPTSFGTIFVGCRYASSGCELYRSDGTAGGTQLLIELAPGTLSPAIQEVYSTGPLTYFVVDRRVSFSAPGENGLAAVPGSGSAVELWVTDGTSVGTRMVTNSLPLTPTPQGLGVGNVEFLFAHAASTVFLAINDHQTPNKRGYLWMTQGASENTSQIAYAQGTYQGRFSLFPYRYAGTTLFNQKVDSNITLKRVDQSGAITDILSVAHYEPFVIGVYQGQFAVTLPLGSTGAHALHVLSPTAPSSTLVSDNQGSGFRNVYFGAQAANSFYFHENRSSQFPRLWRTSGTADSTTNIEIPSARLDTLSTSFSLTRIGNSSALYFLADDQVSGFELWRSDGTSAGTQLIEDTTPGEGNSFNASPFRLVDSILSHPNGAGRFRVHTATHLSPDIRDFGSLLTQPLHQDYVNELNGDSYFINRANDLVRARGNPPALERVVDFLSSREELVAAGSFMYLAAGENSDPSLKHVLWRSDGSTAGTSVVHRDFGTNAQVRSINGKVRHFVLFTVEVSVGENVRYELWRSDGTSIGTFRLYSFSGSGTSEIIDAGGVAYFFDEGSSPSPVLWRTDGSIEGTYALAGTCQGCAIPDAAELKVVGAAGPNMLLYAQHIDNTATLYRSIGTVGGTTALLSLPPQPSHHNFDYKVIGTQGFFLTYDRLSRRLWTTDGTTLGTHEIVNNQHGEQFSSPYILSVGAGKVFFTAGTVSPGTPTISLGTELWALTDQCPQDLGKIVPGQCGCGVADADSDYDRVPNCLDRCAADELKTAPGQCGCGIADDDTDADGTLNCFETCPLDPLKLAPGGCGCGTPDSDTNANTILDCQESAVLAAPEAAQVKVRSKRKRALITLPIAQGTLAEITLRKGRSNKIVRVIRVRTSKITVKKLRAGRYRVSYQVVVKPELDVKTSESPATLFRIRKRKNS